MPRQPIPFSHEHRAAGLGIDYRYCHTGVENGASAGLPDTHTCMSCHSQIWTGAGLLAPVREGLKQHSPLVWARVHDLADFVHFSHQAHTKGCCGWRF